MPARRYFTRFTTTQVELIPSGLLLVATKEIFGDVLEVSTAQIRFSQLNAIIVPSVERYFPGFPKFSEVTLS